MLLTLSPGLVFFQVFKDVCVCVCVCVRVCVCGGKGGLKGDLKSPLPKLCYASHKAEPWHSYTLPKEDPKNV